MRFSGDSALIRQSRKNKGGTVTPVADSLPQAVGTLDSGKVPITQTNGSHYYHSPSSPAFWFSVSQKLSQLFYPVHVFSKRLLTLFLSELSEYYDLEGHLFIMGCKHVNQHKAVFHLMMNDLSGRTWICLSPTRFPCLCLLNRYHLMKTIKYLKSFYH